MTRHGHIFHWDLDRTYLKTNFDTFGDLVRTARSGAEERENIPGSAALIRAIRQEAPEKPSSIYFLSGSPEQLRGVIERKFKLDGFAPDGVVLKATVANILRGRFRAVRGQVAYKLYNLLLARTDQPVGTHETLFGDDAESDAFVYSLYADFVAGKVPRAILDKVLLASGAYSSEIKAIHQVAREVIREDPVSRIIIYQERNAPPGAFGAFFPRLVPVCNHFQSALILAMDGCLSEAGVVHVAEELIADYGFTADALLKLAEDIFRRQRPNVPDAVLKKLIQGPPPEHLSEAATELYRGICDRLDDLLSRPCPHGPLPAPERDYLKLWDEDLARQETARQARMAGRSDKSKMKSPETIEEP